MSPEDQLDLVDQVMSDRTLHSRRGPRLRRLKELGLPDDANIPLLMVQWRERASKRFYKNDQPRW